MQESGLEQVFLASRPKLLRYVRTRLGDVADAEDCLQDLWIKLGRLESGPTADPLAYLFRMAENLVIDRRRSGQRRARREDDWTAMHSAGAPNIAREPSAERVMIDRERLRMVEQVLDELPDRTARAFRMFRVEQIPQKQIADILGISVSAVEKHLQRAYSAVLQAQLTLDAGLAPPLRSSDGKADRVAER
jgi:RNA polymerase sigma-70 factor (ECF subfamily)